MLLLLLLHLLCAHRGLAAARRLLVARRCLLGGLRLGADRRRLELAAVARRSRQGLLEAAELRRAGVQSAYGRTRAHRLAGHRRDRCAQRVELLVRVLLLMR